MIKHPRRLVLLRVLYSHPGRPGVWCCYDLLECGHKHQMGVSMLPAKRHACWECQR